MSLVGVRHDDGRVGFDVWVGGGLSTNPKFAQRLGVGDWGGGGDHEAAAAS